MQRIMLEQAVQDVPKLAAVKEQAEMHQAHMGSELSFDQCFALLEAAAQAHDGVHPV